MGCRKYVLLWKLKSYCIVKSIAGYHFLKVELDRPVIRPVPIQKKKEMNVKFSSSFINFGEHESYPSNNFHPLFPLITWQILGYKNYPGTDTIATTDHQPMRCKKTKGDSCPNWL